VKLLVLNAALARILRQKTGFSPSATKRTIHLLRNRTFLFTPDMGEFRSLPKRKALFSLAHLMTGDIHQPLHAGAGCGEAKKTKGAALVRLSPSKYNYCNGNHRSLYTGHLHRIGGNWREDVFRRPYLLIGFPISCLSEYRS
jgi:hypothetical protein